MKTTEQKVQAIDAERKNGVSLKAAAKKNNLQVSTYYNHKTSHARTAELVEIIQIRKDFLLKNTTQEQRDAYDARQNDSRQRIALTRKALTV